MLYRLRHKRFYICRKNRGFSQNTLHDSNLTMLLTSKGKIHGAATDLAVNDVLQYSTPEEAEADTLQKLKNKKLIIGFGHRDLKKGDPRSIYFDAYCKKLGEEFPESANSLAVKERIEEVILREKGLRPNGDLNLSFMLF